MLVIWSLWAFCHHSIWSFLCQRNASTQKAEHLVGTEAVWHVQMNCCSYRNLANTCIFSNTLSSVVLIPAFVRGLTKHIPRANRMHRWLRVTQFHGFVACAYFWRLRRWHAEKDFAHKYWKFCVDAQVRSDI